MSEAQSSDPFPLLSEEEEADEEARRDLEPGRPTLLEEGLYEYVNNERGNRVGGVRYLATRTRQGKGVLCDIVFRFEGGDTISASAMLPFRSPSIGSGVVAITGGTGRFAGITDVRREVPVEVWNPKRWG